MKNTKKILVVALAALLLVAVSVGGTMAYLTASTTEVKNTFAPTSIAITLKEHELSEDGMKLKENGAEVVKNEGYKVYPGAKLEKDPFVTVTEGNCFIFVEVVNNATSVLDELVVKEGWKSVSGEVGPNGGTLYGWCGSGNAMQAVKAGDDPVYFLKDNQITVKSSLTSTDVTAEKLANVNLMFYAHAVQADNLQGTLDPAGVWGQAGIQ